MSEIINKGWLTDESGTKFAPKTLLSQIQSSDGTLLEVKIAEDILASKNETLASAKTYTDEQIAAIANAEMIEDQINNLNQAITDKADKNYETWMFTLADGTVIEKQVLINA